jgi:hypothetical protein
MITMRMPTIVKLLLQLDWIVLLVPLDGSRETSEELAGPLVLHRSF